MANTKQAQKIIRKTARQTGYNRWMKERVKSAIDSMNALIADTKSTQADITVKFSEVQKAIDKATKKNIFHKNKSNRIKSAISKKIKTRK